MKKLFLCLALIAGCNDVGPVEPPVNPIPGQEVINLVNMERVRVGAPALRADPVLTAEAERYAGVMAERNKLSHTLEGPFWDRLAKTDYRAGAAAENILWNANDAKHAVSLWLSSSGHRANMLNATYKDTGVGIKKNARGQPYYCQIFGKKR